MPLLRAETLSTAAFVEMATSWPATGVHARRAGFAALESVYVGGDVLGVEKGFELKAEVLPVSHGAVRAPRLGTGDVCLENRDTLADRQRVRVRRRSMAHWKGNAVTFQMSYQPPPTEKDFF